MECKVDINAEKIHTTGIDLTRMECKAAMCRRKTHLLQRIDLTRMECKGTGEESICPADNEYRFNQNGM